MLEWLARSNVGRVCGRSLRTAGTRALVYRVMIGGV